MYGATPDLPDDQYVGLKDVKGAVSVPRIIRRLLLRGCNVYHTSSVVDLDVDFGETVGRRTSGFGLDFHIKFNRYFPLVPPILPLSQPDRGISQDFRARLSSPQGVALGEALLEAVISIESTLLKAMFFLDRIAFASVLPGNHSREVKLVWETFDPEMSRLSAEVAIVGFGELLEHSNGPLDHGEFKRSFAELVERAERRRISSSTAVLKSAASRMGMPFEFITRRQLRVGHGVNQQRCLSTMGGSTSYSAVRMSLDKHVSSRQLTQLSLPVPRQIKVANVKEAAAALRAIGGSVVIKPLRGNQGRGITIGVQDTKQIEAAFTRAAAEGRGVVVEELVSGKDYRVTIIGGKYAAALMCVPPHVCGDGARTIRELIDELNAESDRDKLRFSPIAFDDELDDHLNALGYSLDSIPAPGEIIVIRATGHVSRGGIPIDVTDLVHPDNREVAEKAARAMGLDIAGVDFVSPDLSSSYRKVGGRIVEVNSRPGIGMHLWPREGKSRDMGEAILKHMFPDPSSASVPILIVAGDQGRGSVARFADQMLRAKGLMGGLSLKHEAYINGQPADIPSDKLHQAPSILLRQPLVQVLTAAMSLRQLTQHGLGLQNCDVVSMVAADPDKISDDYLEGMAVLLKANRGRFVVGTKNRLALQALSAIDPFRLVLIATEGRDADVSDHIARGRAAVVRQWPKETAELRFTLIDAGKEVASIHMPNLAAARPRHIEAAMHAFALVYTTYSDI